jgi:RNA 2',3'-cyclic 3'-phosphodiesterase
MRCFISIEIPKEIKNKIIKIQAQLPNFVGKKTEEENLHLTLKFLGEVNEQLLIDVKKRLSKINFDKLNLEIDSIGVFNEDYIRIVWLHVREAEELQKEIDLSLKDLFRLEDRFMGHLTIARIKQVEDKRKFLDELEKIDFDKMKFSVDNFKLMKSNLTKNGPVYEVIEEYKNNVN